MDAFEVAPLASLLTFYLPEFGIELGNPINSVCETAYGVMCVSEPSSCWASSAFSFSAYFVLQDSLLLLFYVVTSAYFSILLEALCLWSLFLFFSWLMTLSWILWMLRSLGCSCDCCFCLLKRP